MAVLGNGAEARCLPIVGMRLRCAARGRTADLRLRSEVALGHARASARDLRVPGPDPGGAGPGHRAAALAAYQALGCRDWCRIDVRCDAAGRPMVVELNPLPGILPDPRDNSCFPKAARAAGMSYDELIRTVADIAWRRISGAVPAGGGEPECVSRSCTTAAARSGAPRTWPRSWATSARSGPSSGAGP